MSTSVANGWELVELGRLAVEGPTNGYSPTAAPDAAGTRSLKLSATTQGRLVLNDHTIKYLHERIAADSWAWLEPGDLLVQRSNTAELVGTAAIFDGPPKTYIYPDLMMRLRFADEATTRWVWRYLNSPGGRRFFGTMAAGAAGSMPKISGAKLKAMPVPLPPLAERRRIADILDKADCIRRERKKAIALTEELLRSAFLNMFGDPVTNPKGWPVKPMGELGELDRGRSRHRPRNDPRLLGGAHPLIQTGEVANCDGVIRTFEQTYSDLGLSQSKMWPAGTLAITIAANIAKTGVLAFDACFPDSVVGFTPGDDATTEYVQYWVGFLQPVLERQAPQSAQKNINLEILRSLVVPAPPLTLQQRFSAVVARIRCNRNNMRAALDSSESLFRSLVARAFSGSLDAAC